MNGWTILYAEAAFAKWRPGQLPELAARVLEWFLDCQEHGPPEDALPVPLEEDAYWARIPGTRIAVRYLAVVQDQAIVVKEITDLPA